MAGGGFNFDESLAIKSVRQQLDLIDAIDKFGKVGLERIKECGVQGGPQGAKVEALVESIEDKLKEALEFNESSVEGLNSIITNIGNFDAQTILDKARQQVEEIQKADKVASKKVDFA